MLARSSTNKSTEPNIGEMPLNPSNAASCRGRDTSLAMQLWGLRNKALEIIKLMVLNLND